MASEDDLVLEFGDQGGTFERNEEEEKEWSEESEWEDDDDEDQIRVVVGHGLEDSDSPPRKRKMGKSGLGFSGILSDGPDEYDDEDEDDEDEDGFENGGMDGNQMILQEEGDDDVFLKTPVDQPFHETGSPYVMIPPSRYPEKEFEADIDELTGLNTFFAGQTMVWRDIFGTPSDMKEAHILEAFEKEMEELLHSTRNFPRFWSFWDRLCRCCRRKRQDTNEEDDDNEEEERKEMKEKPGEKKGEEEGRRRRRILQSMFRIGGSKKKKVRIEYELLKERKKLIKNVAKKWGELMIPVMNDFRINPRVAFDIFKPVDARIFARILRLKSKKKEIEEEGSEVVVVMILRYCVSEGDFEDRQHDSNITISTGGLSNRCIIIFSKNEIVSIHRNDIKSFWKFRKQWTLKAHSGKCTDVLYVVNKLVFELVQTFEKPVVRDLRQIDRAYAQVMSARKEESEELIESATRIKRRTQVIQRILLLQKDVITTYQEITNQQDAFQCAHLNDSIEGLLELVKGLHDSAESLISLHISVTEHQVNEILNTLTFISSIFLPLTFFCGVYGMNFEKIPELDWHYGYLYFWMLCLVVAAVICAVYKYKKWI